MAYPERVPGKPNEEKDEPVKLPLDPEEALRALLQVKPDDDQATRSRDDSGS